MSIDGSSKQVREDAGWVRVLDRQDAPCPVCGYNLHKNTSGTCSECGTRLSLAVVPVGGPDRRPIRGVLGYVRIATIVLALAPVSCAFAISLFGSVPWEDSIAAEFLRPYFGAATLLGITALATLFVMRHTHFVVSALFFGLLAINIIMGIISEILSSLILPFAGAGMIECALMFGFLLLSIAGLGVEIMCERESRAQTLLENGTS
ncbi:MAG: hypothetical protein JSU86_11120 [Phycisphaerales bacterium]|nr:MAG: hypothetical protein JSU86_11120 [Phycisphaerales bacterium]